MVKQLLAALLLLPGFAVTAQATYRPHLNIDPSKIEIVRDSFGVPHIFAKTDAEVAYGLAWATAEDDVENAQFMLCAMRGLLAKRLGIDGAKIDFAVQFLGVMGFVDAHYEKEMPADLKRVLEGYADGANAYFYAHPEKVWFKEAFPVRPQDLVAGYMLGMALMGGIDGTINSILSGNIMHQVPAQLADGKGSNAFAFNSAKTKDGNTYIGINAHQPAEGLLSWYEVHLCSEEGWNITGALFHGAATVYLGTNENLSWAHTTGQLDETDVYKLVMHPRKKNQYRYDGQWKKLETAKARMKVKLGKGKGIILPVSKKYWNSVYGPTLKTKHGVYSVRMTALTDIYPVLQWYRMNKARNYTEFREAMNIQGLSRQNITYADRNDTIFFLANGLVPSRANGYDWGKVLPGDTSVTLWSSYLPVDSLAMFVNPSCGWVFNTNNTGFEATCKTENGKLSDYNPHIGYTNDFNNRSLRYYELMEKEYPGKIDFSDFKNIKLDHTYPEHITYKGEFWLDDLLTLDTAKYPDIADAITRIKNFDRTADWDDRNYPIMMYTTYQMLDAPGKEREGVAEDKQKREAFFVECIRRAKAHMLQHFGTMNKALKEVQVISRGDKVVGIAGGLDLIRAVYGNKQSDGTIRLLVGDCFYQLVNYTLQGPQIYSVSAYGASSNADSPHYSDQMELYAGHGLKKMSLKKEEVYKMAEKVYHPK